MSGGTENVAGKNIPGISPFVIAAGLDIESKSGFYLNSTLNHYERIYLNDLNTDKAQPYTLVGGKIGYAHTFAGSIRINVFAGVDNALDQQYASLLNLNAMGTAPGYYNSSAGRNYYYGLSLKYLFK